ncbi:YwmB family TATA-box binding protein [Geobacillus stearothermophilus]|nr:YwmB family TATA-box binding protein [Geobacillus stearothermophilus]MED4986876.1 YwmB family TATA-box binding protein [Geobacillus stearothermophilus]
MAPLICMGGRVFFGRVDDPSTLFLCMKTISKITGCRFFGRMFPVLVATITSKERKGTKMRKNRMKWLLALMLASLFFAAWQYRTEGAQGDEWSKPMETMTHTLAQHGASLGRWVIYTREYAHDIQNDADFFKKMAELKQTYRSFHWSFAKSGHWQKAIGKNEHAFFQEQIQLVMTVTNGTPQTYILYEATGPKWSRIGWKEAARQIQMKTNGLFVNDPTFYACIEGEFNGNMKGGLFDQASRLVRDFQAKPVEWLREESFVSLSAYTGQWKNVLPAAKQQPINLQLALRERLGGKTRVVVGTPIITIEY